MLGCFGLQEHQACAEGVGVCSNQRKLVERMIDISQSQFSSSTSPASTIANDDVSCSTRLLNGIGSIFGCGWHYRDYRLLRRNDIWIVCYTGVALLPAIGSKIEPTCFTLQHI